MTDTKGVKKPTGGWPEYRYAMFKHRVTKLNGLWAGIYAEVESDTNKLLRGELATLNTDIETIFQRILGGFNRLCEVKESDDPNEREALEKLKVKIKEAQELLEGPMQRLYDEMERAFRRVAVAGESS